MPTGLNPGDDYRLVFVTSTVRDALSTDIADYNSFVTGAATAVLELASLGTTWTAIGTTGSVNAITNTGTDYTPAGIQGVPTYLLNDTKLADDYDQLWTSNHFVRFNITENGDVLNALIWTGTSGQVGQWGMSQGASLALGGSNVVAGNQTTSAGLWNGSTFGGSGSTLRPFYAISGVFTVAVPEPSSTALLGLGGLALMLRRRR